MPIEPVFEDEADDLIDVDDLNGWLKSLDKPQWFVRRGNEIEGPYTLSDFFKLPLRSRFNTFPSDFCPALLPTDLIRAPGQTEWQPAGTIKGLFNELVLRNAAANFKQGDLNSLQDAFLSLSQIIDDPQECSDRHVWWKRGECQQLMAERRMTCQMSSRCSKRLITIFHIRSKPIPTATPSLCCQRTGGTGFLSIRSTCQPTKISLTILIDCCRGVVTVR